MATAEELANQAKSTEKEQQIDNSKAQVVTNCSKPTFTEEENVRHVLESLDAAGIEIILYGDPEQDVKGLWEFREIIDKTDGVNYIAECHRCPRKHLNLSNLLACDSEKQVADVDKSDGSVQVVF